MVRSDPALHDAVVAALRTGPLERATLRSALGPPWSEPGRGRDDLDDLIQDDASFTELSGGVVHVPTLLESTSWTVFVDDIGDPDHLPVHPYLDGLGWWLIAGHVALVDGRGDLIDDLQVHVLDVDGGEIEAICGPVGWLDALDGWVSVEVIDGALLWSQVDDPPVPTPEQINAAAAGFDMAMRRTEHEALRPAPPGLRFVMGEDAIHEAILVDPPAFREDPIPPLPALFRAAGLEQRDGMVVAEGFDWPALAAWQHRNVIRLLSGVDDETADAIATLGELATSWTEGSMDAQLAAAWPAVILDADAAAVACWEELDDLDLDPEDLTTFVGLLIGDAPDTVGASWLRARVLDRTGDAPAAMALLDRGVTGRTAHRPTLLDLAGYHADRGDAPGAYRLLQRLGVDATASDEHGGDRAAVRLLDEIETVRHRPRPTTGRNEPCPCGSGRKYKACHLGREQRSLDERSAWLYRKCVRFVHQRAPDQLDEVVDAIVDVAGPEVIDAGIADWPVVADITMHEGGVMDEFLAARSTLLPSDEALLAAQWSLVDRGIFEVVRAGKDRIEMLDISTGEHLTVLGTTGQDARPGTLLVGRPLPVGDTYRAFGGFVPIGPRLLDAALAALDEGGPSEVAEIIGLVLAPPVVTNTDGDELAAITMTWRIAAPVVADRALVDDGFDRVDDGSWTLVRDSTEQANTVVASVRLVDDRLVVDVNSHERADELRERIERALPDAELVDMSEGELDVDDRDQLRPGALPDDPDVRAAVAELFADYERRWLDQSIPGLDGQTPRDAAADPVGRERLTRLLASFPVPSPEEVGVMDPDRLRAALGL